MSEAPVMVAHTFAFCKYSRRRHQVAAGKAGRSPTVRVVSLFCGAGGLDLGFHRAGFDLVWANDHDNDAAETYARNLGSHVVRDDITRVAAKDIPDCNVVIGGFPCQGFSRANLLRRPEDNRNVLYLEFLRVLRVKRPSF